MILTEEMLTLVYEAKVLNVIDGDTIDMKINLGMGVFHNARIRFVDIDAPEIYGVKKTSDEFKAGMVAKMTVKEWLENSDMNVYLSCSHKGIYGRWLGEIWKGVGEESLNDYLKKKFYKSDYWEIHSQEVLIEKWITEEDWGRWAQYDFGKYGLHKYSQNVIGHYGFSEYGKGKYKNKYFLFPFGYYDKALYSGVRYN